VGLGARHSYVHFRNLRVSLSCAGERRSMGVMRNATRVWDGEDGSWAIMECLVLHGRRKKVFLDIQVRQGLSCRSFGVVNYQEYSEEGRLSWRTIDLESKVGQ
jgi:hypothetical protein